MAFVIYGSNDPYIIYMDGDRDANTADSRSAKFYSWTTVEVTKVLISCPV